MQDKPTNYDWDYFTDRMKLAGYATLTEWAASHEFSYQTVWAIIHGTYVSGAGPKIKAIIDQAMREGLIDEITEAA